MTAIALPLPRGHSRVIIENGARGTEQTVVIMQKMVNSYKRNDEIRALAGRIIQKCKSKDYFCYAKSCYEWVRDNIKYAYDPHLVEYIESPKRVLKNKIGDCDSQDMLLASLFEQLGLQSQFVTIMADATRPDEFTHVYTRVLVPKYGWICADPIMPEKYFGWEPPFPNGRRYWHGSTDQLNHPLDTSPSIPMTRDSLNSMSYDGTGSGMSGLDDLGRRGGRGGRGRRGWGGRSAVWGGVLPYYDEPYGFPVLMPDKLVIVAPGEVQTQAEENPLADQSVPVRTLGMNGLAADKLSDSETESWFNSIVNGSFAQKYKDRMSKNQATFDQAMKFKKQAQASKSPAGIAAADKLRLAAVAENQALYRVKAAYNFAVEEIKIQTSGKVSPAALSGLGWVPLATLGIKAAGAVAISIAIYKVASAWEAASVAAVEIEKLKASTTSEAIKSGVKPSDITSILRSYGGDASVFENIGSALLKTGLVFGGVYALYKTLNYFTDASRIRAVQTP